jgi:serine/threonine-protein kinase
MMATMPRPERIGRYRILGELGRGAMGAVYRAVDETLERDVALKVMSHGAADPGARARFEREARAAARLQHPNIIVIYELGEHEGSPFMALELLEGVDLQRGIELGIRPDPRATLPLVLQMLAGLAHAHDHGIVHRDVKPSNIFLPLSHPAKVMDFGVARLAGAGTTTAGTVIGTPNYMSPEQAEGREVDGRSDLFSIGLILYELVTGEKAFRAEALVAVIYKIRFEEPDLRTIPAGAQWERLRETIARALRKRPEERYPDARAMSSDLLEALSALGGGMDWMAPADQALLVRPRPAVRAPATAAATASPPAPKPAAKAAPPPARREPPRTAPTPLRRRSSAFPILAVLLTGSLGLLGFAAWQRFGGARDESAPGPNPTAVPPATATPEGATASSTPALAPTPAPAAPAARPSPPPEPLPATTPVPALSVQERLDRAGRLMQDGRYAQALAEARAVLAVEPTNAAAIALAQDAEVGAVVEECLESARAALGRDERERALAEVRRGLAVRPSDARLLELHRQLTQ